MTDHRLVRYRGLDAVRPGIVVRGRKLLYLVCFDDGGETRVLRMAQAEERYMTDLPGSLKAAARTYRKRATTKRAKQLLKGV